MTKKKGNKRNTGRFAGLPHTMMATDRYIALKSNEKALLMELAYQYNGHNNGNLTSCHAVLGKRGWSKASIWRAYCGLVHAGFVVVSRQGSKHRKRPTLLALTYQPIDDPPKGVVYDDGIKASPRTLGYWCKAKGSWEIQPTLKEPQRNVT